MSLVLHGSFGPVIAAWRWEGPRVGDRIAIDDLDAARAYLARLAACAGGMRPLRRLVSERLATPGFGLDDVG